MEKIYENMMKHWMKWGPSDFQRESAMAEGLNESLENRMKPQSMSSTPRSFGSKPDFSQ